MKQQFFHGSPDKIDVPLRSGTCVSSSKYNGVLFARRDGRSGGFLYVLSLDAAQDIKVVEDSSGVKDCVLTREIHYAERIAVTDDFVMSCKAEVPDLL